MMPHATRPTRATDGAVGYDLTSIAMYVIPAYGRMLISTGLAMEIPYGMYGRIAPRSGLALLHGIDVGAGVIDPDYRGEIKVLLFNHNQEEFEVRAGDSIPEDPMKYWSNHTLIFPSPGVEIKMNIVQTIFILTTDYDYPG